MNLEDVLKLIKEKPTSLFFGAGVSIQCGGPSGGELFNIIRKKFGDYKNDNFLDYMDRLIEFDDSNRNEIEKYIKEILLKISPQYEHKYLFSLPWRVVLTTNYDLLPNIIQNTLDEKRFIRPIADPNEGSIDQRRMDLLYCLKIMGCILYEHPDSGWMILKRKDLSFASLRRFRLYDEFQNLTSSGHIIYLGYSFNDDIVFELLKEMKYALRKVPWKGYAISPHTPDPEIIKKMQMFNIEWIKGTFEEFIDTAKKIYGEIPISAPNLAKELTLHHGSQLEIDRSTAINISNQFRVFTNDLLDSNLKDPLYFFKGTDNSYYTYSQKWDFPRKMKVIYKNPRNTKFNNLTVKKIIDFTKSKNAAENVIFSLIGSAGSGKTVVSKRIAFEWYKSGNPVIFIDWENISLDKIALASLMDEIKNKYYEENSGRSRTKPLRFLLIADDCGDFLDQLVSLKNYLISIAKPADILLISRKTALSIDNLKKSKVDCILEIDDSISNDEWSDFITHFSNLNVLTDIDLLKANLKNNEINSSFFALIYSSIKGVQKTIKEIILDEYNKLNKNSQKIYAIVSSLQSHSLIPWFSVCMKISDLDPYWLDDQISTGHLGGVLRYDSGSYSYYENWNLFSKKEAIFTYNRIIAEIISNYVFNSAEKILPILKNIIEVIAIDDLVELDLLHKMLIDRIEKGFFLYLSLEQQIELFELAANKIKSRPLLHHLALLQMKANLFEKADMSLNEAMKCKLRGFEEAKEHVVNSRGKLELKRADEAIRNNDFDKAWNHLEIAEGLFISATQNPVDTPHPYNGLARTYLNQANLAEDEIAKWNFFLLILDLYCYVESYSGNVNPELESIKQDAFFALEKIDFDKEKAKEILNRIGNANGFAFLAEKEFNVGNYKESLSFVEMGLSYKLDSLWLIRQKVKIINLLEPENTSKLKEILENYQKIIEERFDIYLSFQLAILYFKLGYYKDSSDAFRKLSEVSRFHLQRLIPIERNRWIENGKPKEFIGDLIKPPTQAKYGVIRSSSLSDTKINVSKDAMELEYYNVGDKVSFQIIFNMVGAQASRVRKI